MPLVTWVTAVITKWSAPNCETGLPSNIDFRICKNDNCLDPFLYVRFTHPYWFKRTVVESLWGNRSNACSSRNVFFIRNIYPPFTRKRIVSLYFGRDVRTCLGVASFFDSVSFKSSFCFAKKSWICQKHKNFHYSLILKTDFWINPAQVVKLMFMSLMRAMKPRPSEPS